VSLLHFGDSAERRGPPSFAEALDPRVKLVVALATAAWVALVPEPRIGLVGIVIVGAIVVGALAEVPPRTLVLRGSAALPFVVVPAAVGLLAGAFDPHRTVAMALRGYAAALVATLLVSVTPYSSVLAAASALGVPDLLVQTTALVYRYLAVLRERAQAMLASARARGWGRSSPDRVAVAGSLLGALLVRSLDRSERVHRAMLARGYTGRFPALREMRMRPADWLAAGAFAVGWVASVVAMRA
jgi:cobalt/nickel transport system permease protein